LALQPGRALHREAIKNLLWPHLNASSADANLRKNLHYLRRFFMAAGVSATAIIVSQDMISLMPGITIDLHEFTSAAALAVASRGDHRMHRSALDLYAGDLLPADIYEPWTRSARESACATRNRLLLNTGALDASAGRSEEAIQCYREALEYDNAQEAAHRAIMCIFAARGERALALRQYKRCRQILLAEFGVEPSEETRSLYAALAGVRKTSRRANMR
jgi:DNA-binding SARP family transcriptional activator